MIVFFHGFASAGKGFKSDALKRAFGDNNVVAPDLPSDPSTVVDLVRKIVRDISIDEKLIFVGTSLGGFYANLLAQMFDAPCVIANPSTRPSVTMAARIGPNKNLATGKTFDVLETDIIVFKGMEAYLEKHSNGALVDLFLAKDDTVLDYSIALTDIPYRKSVTITEDGGHRFESNWDLVVDAVRKLI